MARACSSLSAKWSATPERRVWTSAPPSSSAVTSSPVAALTRRAAEEDRTCPLDYHDFVAHRGDVGPSGRATPHHRGYLGYTFALICAWL